MELSDSRNMVGAMAINLPRLLLISYAYPPLKWPRAVQVARLVAGLIDLGYELVLMRASPSSAFGEVDETIATSKKTENLKIIEVNALYNNIVLKLMYRLFPISKKCPDAFNGWIFPALFRARKILKKYYKSYTICTFSNPWSDHVIGLILKKIYKVNWVAHFSDPWALNPYLNPGYLEGIIHHYLENKVIENANKLIFVSSETLEMYIKQYGGWIREKSHVLPHIMPRHNELYLHHVSNNRKIIFLYAGDFYGPRTPLPIINAVQILSKNFPDILNKIQFKLLGNTPRKYQEKIKILKLQEYILLDEPVSYISSLQEMAQADVLVIIDAASDVNSSVFFPSKLVDYFSFSKPILAITPEKGTSARLVMEMGGLVADPMEAEKIVEQIAFLISNIDSIEQFAPSMEARLTYDQDVVAKQFSSIITSINYADGKLK